MWGIVGLMTLNAARYLAQRGEVDQRLAIRAAAPAGYNCAPKGFTMTSQQARLLRCRRLLRWPPTSGIRVALSGRADRSVARGQDVTTSSPIRRPPVLPGHPIPGPRRRGGSASPGWSWRALRASVCSSPIWPSKAKRMNSKASHPTHETVLHAQVFVLHVEPVPIGTCLR
jgi:hypothetical protein